MDSPSFPISDITAEEKINREKMNRQRRNNHKYHIHLSKDIKPFKKRNIKRLKRKTTKQFRNNDMYLQLKNCLFSIEPSILDEESRSINSSQQQTDQHDLFDLNMEMLPEIELVDETNDEVFFNQNLPLSPNDNSQSESIQSTNENLENTSLNQRECELHPFTHISVENTMFDFLHLIRQSQISKKESENFLSFVKSILPFPNQMPNDINTLLKRVGVIDYFKKKTICILCEKELRKNQRLCTECPKREKEYIAHIFDTDIYALLANIVSRLSSDIEEYKKLILNPNPQTTYDIPFGKVYQRLLRQHPNENLLSLLLHVDGISLVKSTKLKLWICDATLVELPPNLRNRRSNMFLVSMYIGYSDPNVTTWLKSSFSNLNSLKTTAFQLDCIQKPFNIKVYGCIADCPALKLMANMIGHNGYFPCFYCHTEGEHIRQASKRQYRYESTIVYRTVKSFNIHSREAQLTNKKIFGHLGISILDEVVDVPLPHSLIIDYAHVSLLRHFRDIVRDVVSSLAPAVRKKIDFSLRSQVFPHFFNRKMKGVADFSFIKANELKNLLLYGFIPHFMHHLTVDQLCFISLFLIGVRLLHADNIFIPSTSTTAHKLLCRYYADHGNYFLYHANFALHLHRHFNEVYELYGPLSSINTFAQEDFIGYIKKNRNGTTSFENLFAYYYNIDVLLKNFHEKNMVCLVDGPLDLFPLIAGNSLSHELLNYHQQTCDCNNYSSCIKIYRRCIVSKNMYHSLQYVKRKNTISYFVKYLLRPGLFEFGAIEVFFQQQGRTYALIKVFQVTDAFSDYLKESRYYELLKQPIDNFFFVLKKTTRSRIVLIGKIETHMIVFEDLLGKGFIITTPISSMAEHD